MANPPLTLNSPNIAMTMANNLSAEISREIDQEILNTVYNDIMTPTVRYNIANKNFKRYVILAVLAVVALMIILFDVFLFFVGSFLLPVIVGLLMMGGLFVAVCGRVLHYKKEMRDIIIESL